MNRSELVMMLAILVTTGNIGEDEAQAILDHIDGLPASLKTLPDPTLANALLLLKGWEFSKPQPAPAKNLLEDDSP